MAKITDLAELTDVASDDLLVVVDKSDTSMSDSGTDKKVQKVNLLKGLVPENGWIPAGETWTYNSADDPTYTFTISGDKTDKYSAGMRIKLTQTTVKYFIITKVAYSSPNTTITVYGGTDYDLANAAITSPYYSMVKAPLGFPMSPAKWSVVFSTNTQVSQASPSVGTVYSTGYSIVIPIGVWDVTFQGLMGANSGGTEIRIGCALSTTTDSISNNLFRAFIGANPLATYFGDFVRRGTLEVSSKTTYYIVLWTTRTGYTKVFFGSGDAYSFVTATCAYL